MKRLRVSDIGCRTCCWQPQPLKENHVGNRKGHTLLCCVLQGLSSALYSKSNIVPADQRKVFLESVSSIIRQGKTVTFEPPYNKETISLFSNNTNFFFFFFFFALFFFFGFLWSHLWHMEVLRLEVELEL